MTAYFEIRAALPGRPRWQLVGFAAGCAGRLLPMTASLGGAAMAKAAEAGVALAWRAAGGDAVQAEIQQAILELMAAMDRYDADPGSPGQLGAHALDVAVFALEAAVSATPTDRAQAACGGALDLVGQVEYVLTHPPLEGPVVVDMDQEEPPGPLEIGEIAAQWASIRHLDVGERPEVLAIEAVQRLSRAQAAELARVMPEFVQRWYLEVQQPPQGPGCRPGAVDGPEHSHETDDLG